MASGSFTLAQLARAVGMTGGAVQFYRDCKLLPPAGRRPGRRDEFAFQTQHVERLRFIQRALGYGFSLQDIAQLVDEAGLKTSNDVYRLSLHRLEELRRDAGPNDATVRALEELIATCPGVGGQSDSRILATLEGGDGTPRRVRPWTPRKR